MSRCRVCQTDAVAIPHHCSAKLDADWSSAMGRGRADGGYMLESHQCGITGCAATHVWVECHEGKLVLGHCMNCRSFWGRPHDSTLYPDSVLEHFDIATRAEVACDCGAVKARTTHAAWCSSENAGRGTGHEGG